MNSKWQKVFSTQQRYQAEIVKAVLEDQQLNPVLIDKQDRAYHFGPIEIYVAPDCVISALKIISDDIRFR